MRWALALRVIVPLLVVLGTAVVVSLRALEREAEARMQDDVALVARALRLPLVHALEQDEGVSVSRTLASAFSIRRVYGAYVYGPDGRRIASYGAPVPDEPLERLSELAAGPDRIGEYGSSGGRRVYSYFVPLTDTWGQGLGLLQITRRRRDFDEQFSTLRRQALAFLLVGTAVVAVLVLHGHHRAVGGPLGRLGASMARVRDGDLSHRTSVEGPVELATLSSTFNTMLDALDRSADELRRRREAEKALERRLAGAEKLAAVGELSAGVAHELGTPLSVIDGLAQRTLRHKGLAADVREPISSIRSQVRRMEDIVRQLLRFGRAESGNRRRVDPADVVQGALAGTSDEAQGRGVQVEVAPPDRPVALTLDVRRVEDAIENLVRNACQAALGGRVRVSWHLEGDALHLHVDDDGPGVPDDLRGRLFEPFFTTKAVGQGTGLGLAVVHGVVEDHGGRVEVARSPLGGARFTLLLPVNPPDDVETGA